MTELNIRNGSIKSEMFDIYSDCGDTPACATEHGIPTEFELPATEFAKATGHLFDLFADGKVTDPVLEQYVDVIMDPLSLRLCVVP